MHSGSQAPIPCPIPDTRAPTSLGLSGNLWLDLQRGMDDMSEYAQAMKTHWIPATDYDALTTRNERQELTIRKAVNDHDTSAALDFLLERGELSAQLSERIDEVAMEFAEKRLNRGEL